jgi:hypothetical protein
VPGTFSFSSGEATVSSAIQSANITRGPGDMLIHALQSRDEFHALQAEMPDSSALLERRRTHLALSDSVDAALRPVVEQIWRYTDKRRVPLRAFYQQFAVCELKTYQAVQQLLGSGHLGFVDDVAAKVA